MKLIETMKNGTIAVANADRRVALLAELVLKTFGIRLTIAGGWNCRNGRRSLEVNGETVPVYPSLEEFFALTGADRQPDLIIFLPEREIDLSGEIGRIIENNRQTVRTILIVQGKTTIKPAEVKEIYTMCANADINVVFNNVIDFGYAFAYVLEEPENLPWVCRKLDQDLAESLAKLGITGGTFLDVGTGAGTQAAELAKRGFCVTATDLVGQAFQRTSRYVTEVEFVEDDILNSKLQKSFDYILDRGCFHSLPESAWDRYVDRILSLLNKQGVFFLKCFSRDQYFAPGITHPRLFDGAEIENIFSGNFTIESIKNTIYERSNAADEVKALFAVMRRKNHA